MFRAALRTCGLVLALAALPRLAAAEPVMIDFESLSDLEVLTNQFLGVTFFGAIALRVDPPETPEFDGSLNDGEFPPHSGQAVVADEFGPVTISFSSLVYNLSGYFTYGSSITLTAFDALGESLGSVLSQFTSNTALFGDAGSSPNELLQFSSLIGISSITIAGEIAGLFTLDDFTYDTDPASGNTQPPSHSVPEPGTLALLMLGGAGLLASRRRAWIARRR